MLETSPSSLLTRRPLPAPWVFTLGVLLGGLAAALCFAMAWPSAPREQASVTPGAPEASARAPAPAAPLAVEVPAKAEPPALAAVPVAEQPPAVTKVRRVSVELRGALEAALTEKVGAELGPPLSQVLKRALVWWVDIPNGLMRGDRVDAVFEPRPDGEPIVHAVRFESQKHGRVFRAYRYQPRGEPFARFYEPDGRELELRLEHGPLADYEQVTSLLRDGRRHKGMDFKTPVGTPLRAPFDGVITRRTWNFRSNGNCLELTESGGQRRRALFLHLAELPKNVRVGQRVTRGQVIGATGNSGRSSAPHLHYQLMASKDRVLDPLRVHRTYRRVLPAPLKAELGQWVASLDTKLGNAHMSGSR